MERSASTLLVTLTTLRWLAMLGQSAAILAATGPLGLAFDVRPLWLGVAALGVFNGYALVRVRGGGEPSNAEAFAHLAVDVGALAWLLARETRPVAEGGDAAAAPPEPAPRR